MAKVGYQCKLMIGDTPTELAKSQDFEFDSTAAEVETTARDDAGWKNFEQGLKEWGGSGQHLWVPDNTAFEMLETAYLNGTKIAVEILDGTSGHGWSGTAIVTRLGRSEPLNGAVVCPFAIKGCGALVREDPT